MSWLGCGVSCHGWPSIRSTASRPMREPRPSPTSSKGARSCSSTTSCSGPTSRPDVRPALQSRTVSPVRWCTWPITTSRSQRCRGRRWPSCRTTSDGWAGAFRGRLRSRATSTTTFTHRTPGRNGSRAAVEYNFRTVDFRPAEESPGLIKVASGAGTDPVTFRKEGPGMSAFALRDGVVFHTYSAYGRGLDGLWGMYSWLDRAPLGRNETGMWWRRHDEYEGG